MNKSNWEEGLKRLEAIRKDAQDTMDKSLLDLEELDFTIRNYRDKIKTFK